MFSTLYPRKIAPFEPHLKCRLPMLSILGKAKNLSSAKGLTLSQMTIFQTQEFAVNNFKFDENGSYKQFLLFPQSFQKTCTAVRQALVFMCLQHKSLENTMGKGEIASDEQFFLFPNCFLCIWRTLSFSSNLELSSANCFSFGLF